MRLIKPKLVDYNFVDFPQKINEIQIKIQSTDNSKLYLNIFMVSILCIGAYTLYNRMINKDKMDNENRANILFLNEYINSSLESKSKSDEENEDIKKP